MPTNGAVLAAQNLSNGTNRVASIKNTGATEGATLNGKTLSTKQQQQLRIANHVNNLQKGTNVAVNIRNNHATDDQNFLVFDAIGVALAKGASANGADIVITSTFAGLSTAAGYAAFKAYISGSHPGVLGTSFKFSDETIIDSCGLTIWNGDLENYNSMNLVNYLLLSEDNYANDQKILNMSTELYANQFLAFSGTLPAQSSLNILFNVVAIANF